MATNWDQRAEPDKGLPNLFLQEVVDVAADAGIGAALGDDYTAFHDAFCEASKTINYQQGQEYQPNTEGTVSDQPYPV